MTAMMPRLKALQEALTENHITEPLIGVEVGVWTGQMSAAMLELWPGLHLTLVDNWLAYTDGDEVWTDDRMRRFKAAALARLSAKPFDGRITVLEMSSVTAARSMYASGLDSADFVFIDADHSFESCLVDCRAWWPIVRPGGLLCGHDFGPYKDVATKRLEPLYGVTEAVVLFCLSHPGLCASLGADGTWFVRKP